MQRLRKKAPPLPPFRDAEARERRETLRSYMAGLDRPTGSLGPARREVKKRSRRRPIPPAPPEPESPPEPVSMEKLPRLPRLIRFRAPKNATRREIDRWIASLKKKYGLERVPPPRKRRGRR